MNAFWLRVSVGAATVLFIIFSTVYYFLEPADTTAYERIPTSAGTKKLKELEMVCELAIDIAGAKTLGIDAGEPARISVSKIDFEKKIWLVSMKHRHQRRKGRDPDGHRPLAQGLPTGNVSTLRKIGFGRGIHDRPKHRQIPTVLNLFR